jgi:hypothetical protein
LGDDNDKYLSLKNLSTYADMGSSTLRYHIRKNGLPCFKVPGKGGHTGVILVKRSEFDGWLERFRSNDFVDPDTVADDVIRSLSDE